MHKFRVKNSLIFMPFFTPNLCITYNISCGGGGGGGSSNGGSSGGGSSCCSGGSSNNSRNSNSSGTNGGGDSSSSIVVPILPLLPMCSYLFGLKKYRKNKKT